jgi:hypothetical protein
MVQVTLALNLIKRHWRSVVIGLLILIAIIQTKRLYSAQEAAEQQLELKDGEIAKISIELGRIRSITSDGSRNSYRPPEAKTNIVIREDREASKRVAELDRQLVELEKDKTKNASEIERVRKERDDWKKKATRIDITGASWGVTLKPGLGALYSDHFVPELDLKVVYAYRYSLKVGITPEFGDIGLSRHVDDLIPFFRFQNIELQVVYGMEFGGGRRWGIGVRSNL